MNRTVVLTTLLLLAVIAAPVYADYEECVLWDNYPGDVLQDVTFNMSSERNTQIIESTWVADDVDLDQVSDCPDFDLLQLTRLTWVGAYDFRFSYSGADVILLDKENGDFTTLLELSDLSYTVTDEYDDPNSPYYNPAPNVVTYQAELTFDDPIWLADLVEPGQELDHFYIGVRLVGAGYYAGRNHFVTSSIDTSLRGRTQGYTKAVTFGAPYWRPASDVWYGTPDGTREENFEFAFRLYAIPEPASLALLLIGSLTLLARRR